MQCNTEGQDVLQLNFDQVDSVPLSAACICRFGELPNLFVKAIHCSTKGGKCDKIWLGVLCSLFVTSSKSPFSFRRIINGILVGKKLADIRSKSENTGIMVHSTKNRLPC